MMKQLRTLIFSRITGLLLLFLILNLRSTMSQEVEDEREFDYMEGSSKGPEHWGEIHEEWKACNNGNMQSPIDLLHQRVEVVSELGKLKRDYKTANATLMNRGHDIMLEWEGDAGSIDINGTDYKLRQCHWHSPSEHTINGTRFAAELHMVHESSNLRFAVIGVLYKIGRPDPFLSELEEEINVLADTQNEITIGMVNPKHIKLGGRKYYRYVGSLTTPPCTEGVNWTIIKRVRTISAAQVKLLRRAVHDSAESNARPLQPLNDRVIELYEPKTSPENQKSPKHE
ncbi:alpha carbonic anhydrase 7-like isoform X1 [Macadamia integrifolia]|uniref:alpha carbonic anhydrase 7-like isoform X1 n=3 Tax=Macadamia integrifolia TaxID=60698 RepID=UPI001C4F486D|nr:alpha carbonic anhydrase 7-like isoform X1 [Macadamia integrifolia]XP_042497227.1 alpha carbonic anhydrase 7-like isoform X1 [Macadamia integrifolia]XP_042497231.1 alpha carbonic anhydrase 7-like isoform X1 [Macadamia integrifolia]